VGLVEHITDSIELLPVIVIRTPGSARIEALLRDLDKIQGVLIYLLDAIMTNSARNFSKIKCETDANFHEIYVGMRFPPSQMGCAVLPNRARA
jgi:hypothetical protein